MACRIFSKPDLYIGNRDDALNKDWLLRHSIGAIVNCTPASDIPFRANMPKSTRKLRIDVVDDGGSEKEVTRLANKLPQAVQFIDSARRKGLNVLVHCRAGQQRSAAVVAAYILFCCYKDGYTGCSVKDAVEFVKDRRKAAFTPRANFQRALDRYRRRLFSLRNNK